MSNRNKTVKNNNLKIGLALGSGGFRGFAHLGAIKAIKEYNIPINYISGSSIGSLVAAYFALHGEIESLEEKFLNYKNRLFKLSDINFRSKFSAPSYNKFIKYLFGSATFSQTKIPLRIIATNLTTGEPYIFSQGSIASAVRASSAVPVILEPSRDLKGGFVDGALSSPVPVDILKKIGAKKIIAINLYHKNEFKEKDFTVTKIALKSIRIALYNLAKNDIKNCDVLLNPNTAEFLKYLSPSRYLSQKIGDQLIEIGYQEAKKRKSDLLNLLK